MMFPAKSSFSATYTTDEIWGALGLLDQDSSEPLDIVHGTGSVEEYLKGKVLAAVREG